ncbi:MAG: DUF481 domain-containing protein [bacterium]|nr:DUF481 domain-containing protein [bacterium]
MKIRTSITTGLLVVALLPQAAVAQDEGKKETGWFNSTDLSLVVTEGNSKTETLGFKDTLQRKWERSNFKLYADVVISDTADDVFLQVEEGLSFAPGETLTDFDTTEVTPSKEPDVEKYFIEGRYTNRFGSSKMWNAGASWDRNEDAGILNRYIGFGGIGNVWKDGEQLDLETSYGLSFTDREEETPDPEKEEQFWGFRATVDLDWRMTEATSLGYRLTGNLNLEDKSDYTIDTTGSLSVNMSKHLALKVSLQFLYNSEPALEDADIFAYVVFNDLTGEFETVGENQGTEIEIGEGQVRKEQLDTVFRTSLVINF